MTQKKMKEAALARANDYRKTFSTLHGKRVLFDLMKTGHLLGSSFSKDPYQTAFNEGERAIVGKILTHLKMEPEQLERLFEESEKHHVGLWSSTIGRSVSTTVTNGD